MSNEELMELFSAYLLAERRLSINTQAAYENALRRLIVFLSKKGKEIDLRKVKERDLHRFVEWLGSVGKSSSTIAQTVSALKHFFGFLEQRRFIRISPAETLRRPRVENRIPRVLSEEAVLAMIAAAGLLDEERKRGTPYRKVLLLLLYGGGMRVSEAISLRREHFSDDFSSVRIFGKGRRERKVPLPEEVGVAVRDVLENFRKGKNPYVVSADGGRNSISREGAYAIVVRAAKRAAVTTKVSPHTLRHSLATHLLRRGVGVKLLQSLLGHRQLGTVQIYTHLDIRTIRDEYDKYGSERGGDKD